MANPSNTLGGLSLTVIAQESLKALLPLMPVIGAFTTDFSSDVAEKGGAVVTRVPSAVTPQDATVAGYTGNSTTSTAKTITLSRHVSVPVSFTDKEVTQITLPALQRTFITPLVNGIVGDVMSGLLANITTGNFPALLGSLTTATFKGAAIASGIGTLNSNNAPIANRNVITNVTYYQALASDSTIAPAYAYGSPAILQDNSIPRLYGAKVNFYNVIGAGQANEGKVGFICSPDALLLASRVPALPPFAANVQAVNVTDPDSNFTLQIRTIYDAANGVTSLAGTIIYGTAVGNSGSLVRLCTGVI
jgi:hypothetical protein